MPRERSKRYERQVALVGQRFKTRRMEAGYSLADLSQRTGIDSSQLSRIERGEQKEMTAGNFFTICEGLALDPLLAWYGETRKPAVRPLSEPPESVERVSKPPQK